MNERTVDDCHVVIVDGRRQCGVIGIADIAAEATTPLLPEVTHSPTIVHYPIPVGSHIVTGLSPP